MPKGIYERKKGIFGMNPNSRNGFKLNELNPSWKGESVGNSGIHYWIKRHKPKSMFCEKCGKVTDRLDASSINHTYERDISKWRWLCRGCHMKEDYKNRKEKKLCLQK